MPEGLPEVNRMYYEPFNLIGSLLNQQTGLVPIFDHLSEYNAQHFSYTNPEGHLYGAYVDVYIKASKTVTGQLVGVQNSWKLRNAVRKFHFERLEMFEKSGIEDEELGKYTQTLKPYFDNVHARNPALWQLENFQPYLVDNQLDPAGGEVQFLTTKLIGGSIAYSKFATSDAQDEGDVSTLDEWTVHICGPHSSSAPPWDSVGMIESYNADRMEVVTPDADSTVTGPENPLALLRSQSLTGGAVAEIAEEQELTTPPYDLADGGDSVQKSVLDFIRIFPYSDENDSFAIQKISNLFVPAGYLAFLFDQTPEDLRSAGMEMIIDVKGVWECRELA